MPTDLPLRCRCGRLRGLASGVSPSGGNRVVCLCDDCQDFARFLGRAEEVLDAHGGTDIFQMTPAQLTISEGADVLRCMRLTDHGILRWFAGCCRTPVANTVPSAKVPFAGVVHSFMDHAGDGRSRDDVLGPPRAWLHGRFGVGIVPDHVHPRIPLRLIGRSLRLLAVAWAKGRFRPSPFFDDAGTPVSVPEVLDPERRRALRAGVPPPGAPDG